MTDSTTMNQFVWLSVAVTGCSQDTLVPGLDPVNLKQLYFDTMQARDPNGLNALLSLTVDVLGPNPGSGSGGSGWGDGSGGAPTPEQLTDLGQLCLNDEPTATAELATMWYLGVWFEGSNQIVLSDQAYIGGLSWKVAQAHAMGYAETGGPYWGYGYWNSPPPPLMDFVGVQGSDPVTNPQPNAAPEGE